jgi:hypothetical protein
MSYVDFKALVKKVNLKPKGVKEIVLEISGTGLDGKLDKLSEMIDHKAEVQLESMIVNYSVQLDVKTNKPITEYKVDDKGVVQEVKNESDQIEADLGIPEKKPKTIEETKEVDRKPIDDFILEGMAPNYDDLPDDFANIVKRRLEGESYSKLATELEISSGQVVDMIDDFRKRVAPLAQAWAEWKEENEVNSDEVVDKEDKEEAITTDKEQEITEESEADEENGAA